ncbi:MAG: GGDEF domain-containing protein [Candidatus Krumholzibacteriota bacterium]
MLSGELPLEKVGPHLRHACRRALRSGDFERMRLAAKVVVTELARRGELVGIALDQSPGNHSGGGPFCMAKGSRRVFDLSILGDDAVIFPQHETPAKPPAPPVSSPVTSRPASQLNLDVFTGILGAMEQAQDLEIGDPRSGENGIILVGILELLGRFMPQFPMFIMWNEGQQVPEEQEQLFKISTDESETGWLSLRTPGHSVWIPDPAELPAHIRKRDRGAGSGQVSHRRAVAVPLWEPKIGDRSTSSPQESGLLFLITDDDLTRDLLLGLGERLSRFVTRRWQHQREVNQRIHVDSLTGAFNRAFFDAQFPLELERARRSEVPLTLVIADLDKFKRINDTHGHQAGDEILRMVARRLHEELRRIDLICRIGGEEFALILPDTSQDAAQDVMSRLLDSSFSTSMTTEGETIEITATFSYGAVTFPAAGADPLELYRKADGLLFLSKDLGRNRCHFWNSDGDHLQILPSDPGD